MLPTLIEHEGRKRRCFAFILDFENISSFNFLYFLGTMMKAIQRKEERRERERSP
jgi:hypothetical protein